jgi:WD40 repeat protein
MSPFLASGRTPASRYLLALLPWAIGCGEELPSASDPGELLVSIVSTGRAIDPNGYLLHVDHGPGIRMAANGTRAFVLPPGQYTITLDDVSSSCILLGNTWVKFISAGRQSVLELRIECPAPGSVVVTTSTTGLDRDPDGYLLVVNGLTPLEIGPDGFVRINQVRAGQATVDLRGVAGNCDVQGSRSRGVTVEELGTSELQLDITCRNRTIYPAGEYLVVARRLNHSADQDLFLLTSDGTELEQLTDHPDDDIAPSFSPAGDRIAFLRAARTSFEPARVLIFSLDSGQETVLPQRSHYRVGWSPDGNQLAINREGNLSVVTLESNTESSLALSINGEAHWSPDGSRIAVARGSQAEGNIYVVAANGADLRQLTKGGYREAGPWSPSGDQLLIRVSGPMSCAFLGWPSPCGAAPLDLATLDPVSGSENKIVTVYEEYGPAWTTAGDKIVFLSWDAGQSDVYLMSLDGDRVVNLTRSFTLEESFAIGRRR